MTAAVDPARTLDERHERGAFVVRLAVEGSYDMARTLRPLADGGSDPSWAIAEDVASRALTTPEGDAVIEARAGVGGCGTVEVRTMGPGGRWIAARAAAMLGIDDDPSGFDPGLHPLVRSTAARRPGIRHGASLRLADALVPVILGQRVTVGEARRSWFRLVRRHGRPAPGRHDLWIPPSPALLARLGPAEWHTLGVDRGRADTVRRAVGVLPALERAAAKGSAELVRALTTVRGVGPWTATALASTVLGDPDVVLLGDLHLPNAVCWALAREARGTDERMLELLEPWRGHRGRVVRLLRSSGVSAPRRGPRYTPLPIERW